VEETPVCNGNIPNLHTRVKNSTWVMKGIVFLLGEFLPLGNETKSSATRRNGKTAPKSPHLENKFQQVGCQNVA